MSAPPPLPTQVSRGPLLRGGEAPEGLLKSSWGSAEVDWLLWGVFSAERTWDPPADGGGARAGVAPFWRGVLGGRFLSTTSGERGAPKRTHFFRTAELAEGSPSGGEGGKACYFYPLQRSFAQP